VTDFGHESILMDCPMGAYMLNELENEEDSYYIDTFGTLYTNEGSLKLTRDQYCIAKHTDEDNVTVNIAMVCFEENPAYQSVWLPVKTLLISISVSFLVLTLYIYWVIPELRQTEDKVTCIAIFCLFSFLVLLGLLQVLPHIESKELCVLMGFGIYFFAIAYFAWLNVIMLNVWKNCVLHRWQIKERNWFILNNIYGWTLPCAALTIGIILHIDKPSIGEVSCFFDVASDQWMFLYLPMSILLGINLFLGIWTTYSLHRKGGDISQDRRKRLRFKLYLYLRLFILAGVTWIFEVLSFTFGESQVPSHWFWIICDVVNALHGVLIFLVLILWRSRIKRELAGRKLCCFRCPARWADVDDIEQEQLAIDEDEHLYRILM